MRNLFLRRTAGALAVILLSLLLLAIEAIKPWLCYTAVGAVLLLHAVRMGAWLWAECTKRFS